MANEKIGIVVANFNEELTGQMLSVAKLYLQSQNADVVEVLHVPGAFEIPFGCKRLLDRDDIDGVVTLGAIIQGDTAHDEVIAHSVAKQLLELQCDFGKPIGFGISGPRMTRKQAEDRINHCGQRSSEAVLSLLRNGSGTST